MAFPGRPPGASWTRSIGLLCSPEMSSILMVGLTRWFIPLPFKLNKVERRGLRLRSSSALKSGRDGQALLFGGRDTPLPVCDQADYRFQESLHDWGIVTGGDPELPETHHSWLVIDGRKWGGIGDHRLSAGRSAPGAELEPYYGAQS